MDTIQQFLRARAEQDTTALIADDQTWTWREYVAAASARANAVARLLTPDRPPHVGVVLENTPEMALALAAAELPATATNKVLKRVLVADGLDFVDPRWVRDERGTAYHRADS